MEIELDGQIYDVPDDATEDEIRMVLGGSQPVQEIPQQEPQGSYSPLGIAGEFANAANRGVADTLDFLGPGTINAGISQFTDSDYRLPTFGGGLDMTPGGEGGFLPEGAPRDALRAAGATLPAAAGFAPVAGRNLASKGGALAELVGLGTQKAPSASAAASQAQGLVGDLSAGPAANIVERADDLGWPLSFGDRTGNRTVKAIESAIESTPMPGNPINRINDERQAILQRAAARSLGVPADTRLTQDAVGDIAGDLGDEFQRLTVLDDLPVDEQFVDDLINTADSAKTRLFKDPQIQTTIDSVFDKVDDSGRLSVPDYQDMASELKAKVRQAWKGESPDPYFAESLSDIIDALDNLAMNNMDPKALSDLKRARSKWKALSQLEKSRSIHESGDISGPLLANYLRRTDKGGYGRGKNTSELYEAARASKAFPSRPDSGTAGRQYINNLLQNPISGGLSLLASPITSTVANAFVRGPSAATRLATQLSNIRPPALSAGRTGGRLLEDDR